MLAFLGVLRGVGLGAAGAGHVVTPVFVEFAEDLEFLVLRKIHFVVLRLGGVRRGRGFGGIVADFAGGIGVLIGGVVLGAGLLRPTPSIGSSSSVGLLWSSSWMTERRSSAAT